jgi:hypothetical protein
MACRKNVQRARLGQLFGLDGCNIGPHCRLVGRKTVDLLVDSIDLAVEPGAKTIHFLGDLAQQHQHKVFGFVSNRFLSTPRYAVPGESSHPYGRFWRVFLGGAALVGLAFSARARSAGVGADSMTPTP